MPHLNRARIAIAGLLIAIAIAGLHVLGPAGNWAWPTSRLLLVGGALELALAALLAGLYWRRRRPAPPAGDLSGKLRQILTAVLVACLIVVGLLVLISEARPSTHPPGRSPPPPTPPPLGAAAPQPPGSVSPPAQPPAAAHAATNFDSPRQLQPSAA